MMFRYKDIVNRMIENNNFGAGNEVIKKHQNYMNKFSEIDINTKEPMSKLIKKQPPVISLVGDVSDDYSFSFYEKEFISYNCIVNSSSMITRRNMYDNLDKINPLSYKKKVDVLYMKSIINSNVLVVLNSKDNIDVHTWDFILFAMANDISISFVQPLEENCLDHYFSIFIYEKEEYFRYIGFNAIKILNYFNKFYLYQYIPDSKLQKYIDVLRANYCNNI